MLALSFAIGCAKCRPEELPAPDATVAVAPQVKDAGAPRPRPMAPPYARSETTQRTVFGHVLTDEYAWMKKKGTPEIEAWLKAENAWAQAQLEPLEPLVKTVREEIEARQPEIYRSVPFHDGTWWYFEKTDPQLPYAIWLRAKEKGGEEEVVLDPNTLKGAEKYFDLQDWDVTDDGEVLGALADLDGDGVASLSFTDLAAHQQRDGEVLPRVSSFAFTPDNRSAFYAVVNEAMRSVAVRRHELGTPVEQDVTVLEEKDGRFSLSVRRTLDAKWMLFESDSYSTSEVQVLDASKPRGTPSVLVPRVRGVQYDAVHQDGRFFVRINDTGPGFRLVELQRPGAPRKSWKERVPHRRGVALTAVTALERHLVLEERVDGKPTLRSLDATSFAATPFELPTGDFAVDPGANPEYAVHTFRYTLSSLVSPEETWERDLDTGKATLLDRRPVPRFAPEDYEATRITFTARDGTAVPVSLAWKKGTPRDGTAPLYLTAYGAYGVPSDPYFTPSLLSWLDRGCVFAIAHIRGGGEFGEAWHDAGRLANKHRTFDDFVDVAQGLVNAKWTAPDRLVISGGSAGGLLMGAVLNARPELFKAALVEVPFVDVVNTMLDASAPLTVEEYDEWGDPRKKPDFERLLAYSPYDNVKAQAYPALLVRAAYDDALVLFHEPSKWVAKLRALKTNDAPLLFWVDLDGANHGGRTARADMHQDEARRLAFLLWQVGKRQ